MQAYKVPVRIFLFVPWLELSISFYPIRAVTFTEILQIERIGDFILYKNGWYVSNNAQFFKYPFSETFNHVTCKKDHDNIGCFKEQAGSKVFTDILATTLLEKYPDVYIQQKADWNEFAKHLST